MKLTPYPLPPLPLVDGHLFIDNSFLDKFNSCPRAAEYTLLHRRVLANAAAALNYGGAIHAALAHRYTTSGDYITPTVENEQCELLTKWFEEKPNPVDDHRTLELACSHIRAYNKCYFSETFNVLHWQGAPAVELPFTFHLGEVEIKFEDGMRLVQVMYCGRIDLVVQDDNQVFVVDHKTSSIMGDQFFKGLSVSPQMMGYICGLESLAGQRPAGFIVNSLRVPSPRKREGMVIKDDDFQRLKTYVHDSQTLEWRDNTMDLVEEFAWRYNRGFMAQKKSWCVHKFGLCEYFEVCAVPRENRKLLLDSGMFVDNEWSPLNDFPHELLNKPTVKP